jgi:hypothetical protein
MRIIFGLIVLATGSSVAGGAEPATKPFAIHVIDDQSGRGVPLVELKTVSNVSFWTDSAGYAAIDDPALLGHRVFFSLWSHGYEYPKDGFGYRGKAIDLTSGGGGGGGEATLKIKRLNIAERLYRITGEGIYRDSMILGKPVPIAAPLLNGQVTGQDSALAAVYGGKIWWFWGDTNRQAHPLGHFSTAGARSELPGNGGLDPPVGINLTYFVNQEGFSRPMVPPVNRELHWVFGLAVVKDEESGAERLIGSNTRVKRLSEPLGREIVVMNDRTATFEVVRVLDLKSPHLRGHPFHHVVEGVDYLYWGEPYPCQRVKADFKSATDPSNYEAYVPQPRDDADGTLRWAWQKGAAPLDVNAQERRISAGEMKADETPFRLCDAEGGGGGSSSGRRFIRAQFGSVNWNAYRKKWVMIFVEQGGKPSFLGEIWYAEADAPEGPWRTARKIVTHERYSFYNPVHHAFFDQEGGRCIYFEGTYTTTFSRESDAATPRYDYNQIMYRLDLADERLHGGGGDGPVK